MPVVVPSQVVEFIDTSLRFFIDRGPHQRVTLSSQICGMLSGLLRLVEQIPEVLLPRRPQEYSSLVSSIESVRFAVAQAKKVDIGIGQAGMEPALGPVGPEMLNDVEIIRKALEGCSDEVPPRQSNELLFVSDSSFRERLLIDLESVRSTLTNAEWKASTVLAGSLTEALLLWAIQAKFEEMQSASGDALTKEILDRQPSKDPLAWGLATYVTVAEELKLIESNTALQARLAKDFRNLIHPGRAIRAQQTCDRGTALAASAALELVMRDLKTRFP